MKAPAQLLGKLGYGALFCLAMPALLARWTRGLDRSATAFWPQPLPAWSGVLMTLAAAMLMGVSMWALWTRGDGLPMNAYPTTRFVGTSTYALFSHPIYVAFVLLVAGCAVMANSPAGLWVTTPVSALSVAALVFGYEGPKLRERFGPPDAVPWFGLPGGGSTRVSLARRFAAAVSALAPWAVIYSLLSAVPAPDDAAPLRMVWEVLLPQPEWAVWLYTSAYLAAGAPLLIRVGPELRRFIVSAWLATGLGFLWMLTLPGQVASTSGAYSSAGAWLLRTNRMLDADWLASPSFHVLWTAFAAFALTQTMPRLRALWWAWTLGVGVSCVLTGSHAVVDVLCGLALAGLCWHHERVWAACVRIGERLGNSWSSVRVGPVRIINHAIWSGAAACTGTLLVLYLAGPEVLLPSAGVILAGLLCAGAWGYVLEGGSRLSRPFGYYGFLLGSLLALGGLALAGVAHADALAAALAGAAPIAQAIGRLRCIVQGCCHGRPAHAAHAFTVTHPMSRVTALGNLAGVPIHPTQMYSIAGNLVAGAVLLRLWAVGADWTLIAGLYLVLSSIARFVEEQYRGEPQTARWFGLPIYQWLAIGHALFGVAVSMAHGGSVKSAHWISLSAMLLALAVGLTAAFLMSVDFPESTRRFSRLTVGGA